MKNTLSALVCTFTCKQKSRSRVLIIQKEPLLDGWKMRYDGQFKVFVDHNTGTTTHQDPQVPYIPQCLVTRGLKDEKHGYGICMPYTRLGLSLSHMSTYQRAAR